ncbi:MAG TPA: gephyrin-like molybdotransferase Glp [Acidimicrobiales bacterium]|nr:gephyrin-like molybdotransferase Glp [Acidimicrobiales bacterium]
MIPLEEARAFVVGRQAPLGPTKRTRADALGCVLASAVVAGEAVPPFANAAMDGYAVRAADCRQAPTRLEVVAAVMAGDAPGRPLGPGQAARIMTGAPIPPGADAVCVLEASHLASPSGDVVVLEEPVEPGDNVRQPGEDLRSGEVLFRPGTVLGPAHLGVLAGLGIEALEVHPRPKVGVLATGSELVAGAGPLPPGKIRDANRPALLALLARAGFDPVDLGIVHDDETAIAAALERAAECDAVLATGGASHGDRDVLHDVLAKMASGACRSMEVSIKPAKPFVYGEIGPRATPVFGLPGNPVSALVSFELLARPALRAMAGERSIEPPLLEARAAEAFRRRPDGRTHFLRAVAGVDGRGRLEVRSAGGQGSHQLSALARANALVVLPDGEGPGPGEAVRVLLLDPDRLEVLGP